MDPGKEISEDLTVEELIERFPAAVPLLHEQGIVCLKCGEPVWGTLGEAIARKGLDVRKTMERLRKSLGS